MTTKQRLLRVALRLRKLAAWGDPFEQRDDEAVAEFRRKQQQALKAKRTPEEQAAAEAASAKMKKLLGLE